jgi:hypothetical protein
MAKKRTKKKRSKQHRRERRFVPDATTTTGTAFLVGVAGSLALGAGVYAVWIAETAMAHGNLLVGVGAALFVMALWLGQNWAAPVRIGNTGVAIERSREIVRLRWCDLDRVKVEQNNLVATGKDGTGIAIPLKAHPVASAWLLSEVARRVPDAMDVKSSIVDSLPRPDPSDGEQLPVEEVQVAGRECAASGEPIALEKDARVCPTCAQVYHRDHAPRKCITCGGDVLER